MKISIFSAWFLIFLVGIGRAQETAPVLVTKTVFVEGLKEPMGLAISPDSSLLVADYQAGEVLKFAPDGKPLGAFLRGLQGPTFFSRFGDALVLSESKSNRVLWISATGETFVLCDDIGKPSGVLYDKIGIYIVAQATSQVWKAEATGLHENGRPRGFWVPIYAAPVEVGQKQKHSFRALAKDPISPTLFLSDENLGQIFMLTPSGFPATFATGLQSPSGLAFSPDGKLYVAQEGNGGQLIRLSREGKWTVVAEGLGHPSAILFLDAKTALVSNRDGNVWKLVLP